MSAGVLWVLLALASASSLQAAGKIPGTKLEPAELVAELPWAFEVGIEASGEPEGDQEPMKVTHYRFKSTEPYSTTAAGKVYLRLRLTTSEHGDANAAEAALEELLAGADPDTGLSYAWDHVLLSGAVVYHLHAPCLFSEDNFRRLVSRLEAAVKRPGQGAPRAVACRCGGGCRGDRAELPKQRPGYDPRMQSDILCQSAGWVLFADGSRLVFADRGTSYRRVLLFVLVLLTLIAGVNCIVWLALGFRSGETGRLGIVLVTVALLAGLGAWRVWLAEKRDRTAIPPQETWVAVLDLETQTLETPEGESLAPLSDVRFVPVMQLASSSRALAANWPGGSTVVYRGSPFGGSFQAAIAALRRHGVDTE